MVDPRTLSHLLKSCGVTRFLLQDSQGAVVIHDMENPETAAKAIFLSARHLKAVGKHQFRHALFDLGHGRTMILFPLDGGVLSLVTGEEPQGILHALERLGGS